mgnify:FL=1
MQFCNIQFKLHVYEYGPKNLGKAQFVLSQTMAAFAQKIFEGIQFLNCTDRQLCAMQYLVFL